MNSQNSDFPFTHEQIGFHQSTKQIVDPWKLIEGKLEVKVANKIEKQENINTQMTDSSKFANAGMQTRAPITQQGIIEEYQKSEIENDY